MRWNSPPGSSAACTRATTAAMISRLYWGRFDAMMAQNKARQGSVPQVGAMAPDFTIERLSRDRKRTGEYVTLSELRGKPVALGFGSYT